eukprot:15725-Heterococcus_DN1.PRE.5
MCALYRDPKQLKHSLYVLCCKTSGAAAWGRYWSAVVAMLRGELAKAFQLLSVAYVHMTFCSHTHAAELDRIVMACLGAQGVPLHNQFIICLWQNAQCTQVPCSLETVAQLQPRLSERCTRVNKDEPSTLDSSNQQQQQQQEAPADAAGALQAVHACAMCVFVLVQMRVHRSSWPASNQKESLRADSSLNNSADLNSSRSTNTNAHTYEPMGMVEITEFCEVRTGAEPCYDDNSDQKTQMQQSD